MHEGERLAGEVELAPGAVERRTDVGDGFLNVGAIVVAVAKDEMRVSGEEPNGLTVLDVAAMDDKLDLTLGHNR